MHYYFMVRTVIDLFFGYFTFPTTCYIALNGRIAALKEGSKFLETDLKAVTS
jgi:hypothetical protein